MPYYFERAKMFEMYFKIVMPYKDFQKLPIS